MYYVPPQKALFVLLTFQFVDLQAIADPCPGLKANHLGRKLFEAPDGHHCCGCEPDYYVQAICRPDNFKSTVCTKCPEGSGIAENAHGKGKDYCKKINSTATPELPTISPTNVPNIATETLPQNIPTSTKALTTTATITTITTTVAATTLKTDTKETNLSMLYLGVGIILGILITVLVMFLFLVFCKHKDVKWRQLWNFFRTSNSNPIRIAEGGNTDEQDHLLNGSAPRNGDMEMQEMNRHQQPPQRNDSQPNAENSGEHAFNDNSRSVTPKAGCSTLNQRDDEFVGIPEDTISRGRSSTQGSGLPHSSENTPQTDSQREPGCSSGDPFLYKTTPLQVGGHSLTPDDSPMVGGHSKNGRLFALKPSPHGINHRVVGSADSTPKVSRNQQSSYTERRSTMPQEQAAKGIRPGYNTKQPMPLTQDYNFMPNSLQLNQDENRSVPCLIQVKHQRTPRAATALNEKLNKVHGDRISSSRGPSHNGSPFVPKRFTNAEGNALNTPYLSTGNHSDHSLTEIETPINPMTPSASRIDTFSGSSPHGKVEYSSDSSRTSNSPALHNGRPTINDGASTSGYSATGSHNIASETVVKVPISSHNGSRSSTPYGHSHLNNSQGSSLKGDSPFPTEAQRIAADCPTNTGRLNVLPSTTNRNEQDTFKHPAKVNMNEVDNLPEPNGVEQAHSSNIQDCNLPSSDDDKISKLKTFFSGLQNMNPGISLDLDNARQCARDHGIAEIDITRICQGNVKQAFVDIIIKLHNRKGQSFSAKEFIEYFRKNKNILLAEELDKELGFETSPSKKTADHDETKE